MPLYDYQCAGCDHEFSLLRPMAESAEGADCPSCGLLAIRQISAPRLTVLTAEARRAHQTNERSAHAPRVTSGHRCSSSCNHGESRPLQAAKANKRPWMIGH